jgi:hypothetical protein
MSAGSRNARAGLERFLRALCRCDGARDMAVVAALLVVAAALAIRLAQGLWPVRHVAVSIC